MYQNFKFFFGYLWLDVNVKCDFEACNGKYLTGYIIVITMIKYSILFSKFVVKAVWVCLDGLFLILPVAYFVEKVRQVKV